MGLPLHGIEGAETSHSLGGRDPGSGHWQAITDGRTALCKEVWECGERSSVLSQSDTCVPLAGMLSADLSPGLLGSLPLERDSQKCAFRGSDKLLDYLCQAALALPVT